MTYRDQIETLKPDIIIKDVDSSGGCLFFWTIEIEDGIQFDFAYDNWDPEVEIVSRVRVHNGKLQYNHWIEDGMDDAWEYWEHGDTDLITGPQIVDILYDHINDVTKVLSE